MIFLEGIIVKKCILAFFFLLFFILIGCTDTSNLTTKNFTDNYSSDTTAFMTTLNDVTSLISTNSTASNTTMTTSLQTETENQKYTINYKIIGVDQIGDITLSDGETIMDIDISYNSSAAITSSGRLLVWGENNFGQLGDGTTNNKIKPLDITSSLNLDDGEKVVAVKIGSQVTAILTSTGRLLTAGYNGYAQLGVESIGERFTFEEISGINLEDGDQIIDLSLGKYHASVISASGRIFMWGYNSYGCIGNNNTVVEPVYNPIEITSMFSLGQDEKIIKVSLENYQSAALTSSGRVFMWGYNIHNELGDGTDEHRYSPIDITDGFSLDESEIIKDISLGHYHSGAITSMGRIFMWGYNAYGQIGDETLIDKSYPLDVTSYFNLAQDEIMNSVALGAYHSLATSSFGRVFTWGRNFSGQLGSGTFDYDEHALPIDITSSINLNLFDKIISGSLGNLNTSVISSTGRIFSWGENNAGQLGDNSITDKLIPTEITNVGESVIHSEMVEYGISIDEFIPNKPGYIFTGWYEDQNLVSPYVFETMPSYSFNLYGMWFLE